MSETTPPPPPASPPPVRMRRPRFQLVWLVPIVAAVIAGYLGYRTLIEQGPLLTLSFNSAEGLEAGQTQVKYKAVALGTVESIDLARDDSHVIVKVRMNGVGARFLNANARYWVERPRLNFSDISGIETIVSGAYISVDPGKSAGPHKDSFVGLEQPPGVRSDEPGRTYTLTANTLGSISSGSPIFFRDVIVGEVLGYDIGNGLGPIKINVFIRAPFDDLVRQDSRFWNSSGVSFGIQGGVLQLQLQSVQALVAGGITFSIPQSARGEPPSADGSSFHLYSSKQEAEAATYSTQINVISYTTSDVSGLTAGAPVNALGIEVGDVTGVDLLVDPETGHLRVRVRMQLQPERILDLAKENPNLDPQTVFQRLVDNGMRVELGTASYVTGQKNINLLLVPNAPAAKVTEENGIIVLPFKAGGLDETLDNVADITGKVDKIDFQQLGKNLNRLLVTANGTLGGPQVKQLLTQLSVTLQNADTALQDLHQGFGQDSDFQRSLQQILEQTNSTLQSLQGLTNYLNQHPQSLIFGRSGS